MNNSKAFVPKQNRIKDRGIVSTVLLYFFAALIAFITIYPMYYVLVLSFSSPREALTMRVYWWPKGFFVDGYKRILTNSNLWLSYRNTIMYCTTRAILTLATSVLAAYPLTVKHLYGRKFVTMFLLIPMYVSGGIIPEFILMTKLGLYNSPLALILPGSYAIFYIVLVRSYFRTIPESLRESAKIDGANSFRISWNVFLPTSKPILAVIALYTIIGVWNGTGTMPRYTSPTASGSRCSSSCAAYWSNRPSSSPTPPWTTRKRCAWLRSSRFPITSSSTRS